MKLALLTSEKSLIDPLGLVEKKLKENIAGIETSRITSPNNLDLAQEVKDCAGFDIVCVALYYSSSTPDVEILMRSLVELGSSGIKTMKFIEMGEDFDENEEAQTISNALIKKITGRVPKKE